MEGILSALLDVVHTSRIGQVVEVHVVVMRASEV